MDLNASHTGYVLAAYALSALVLAGLTVYILWRDARKRREAAEFNGRGGAS